MAGTTVAIAMAFGQRDGKEEANTEGSQTVGLSHNVQMGLTKGVEEQIGSVLKAMQRCLRNKELK